MPHLILESRKKQQKQFADIVNMIKKNQNKKNKELNNKITGKSNEDTKKNKSGLNKNNNSNTTPPTSIRSKRKEGTKEKPLILFDEDNNNNNNMYEDSLSEEPQIYDDDDEEYNPLKDAVNELFDEADSKMVTSMDPAQKELLKNMFMKTAEKLSSKSKPLNEVKRNNKKGKKNKKGGGGGSNSDKKVETDTPSSIHGIDISWRKNENWPLSGVYNVGLNRLQKLAKYCKIHPEKLRMYIYTNMFYCFLTLFKPKYIMYYF